MERKDWIIWATITAILVIGTGLWMQQFYPQQEQQQKLNQSIEVQLGQPIIINTTTNEIRLDEKLPYSESIPGLNPSKGEQGFIFWTYYVPEIKAGHYQIVDLKEKRIQEEPGTAKAFGAISYERYNTTGYLSLTGYQEEGETEIYDDLQITWEKTMKASGERYGYGDEYVIVICARISEL